VVKVPELRRALRGLASGEILIPALQTALHDPSFSALDIHIGGFQKREPDGYFHPSGHATWNVRQLALYRMAPHLLEQGVMPYTGTLSITQGHFWHAFIQHILKECGLLIKDEVGFTDEAFQRKGHMDGLLKDEGLEIKTINSRRINSMVSEEALKQDKYQYWCQAQEYLDVFNLPQMRFLFITPDFPFPMKEFVVKANPEHQAARREIYAKAIEIADVGKLPISKFSVPCCGKPDQCPTVKGCHYGD
jgi:hypothetical protein